MTVKELVEALNLLPEESRVMVQVWGRDGDAKEVVIRFGETRSICISDGEAPDDN